jgi:hypothetical protein
MRSSFRPWTAAEEGHYAIGGVPLTKAELERGVPTVTTTVGEVWEGSFPEDEHDPESTAETRACARASVPSASSVSRQVVTDSAQVFRHAWVSAVAFLDRDDSLIDAQPMTFRQAREHHHRCGSHYGVPLIKVMRLAWGYFHLLIVKPVLNLAEWVTESPARFLIAVAVYFVIRIWG